MNYSELSADILKIAEEIQKKAGADVLSAPCIIAAVCEICSEPYKGITDYDCNPYPEFYEEERLRYIFRKIFKSSANLTGNIFKIHLKRELLSYGTDFLKDNAEFPEAAAKMRGKGKISAENIFLAAVKSLKSEHRYGVHAEYRGDFAVNEVVSDTDKNIYDFVIEETEKIIVKLQEKSAEAKKKRDWKPAEKFAEPEEILEEFFKCLNLKPDSKMPEVTVPGFFGSTRGDLRLTFAFKNDCCFVHDNGSALAFLRKTTGDTEKFNEIFGKIRKNLSLDGERIICVTSQIHTFLHYLQVLIFVAHADLYVENLFEDGLYCDSDMVFAADDLEDFPLKEFAEEFKNSVYCKYDENSGIMVGFDTTYAMNSTTVSFLLETSAESIKISDNRKGEIEGEIFETFYWDNDDISIYGEYIKGICRRFGADFDGKDISLTLPLRGNFVPHFFAFLNLAVLLSEFGRLIELPVI